MVKYPNLRAEILLALDKLADADHQRRRWIEHLPIAAPIDSEVDGFDEVVHTLLDDSALDQDPERQIGVILEDQRELDVVLAVVNALDELLDKYGTRRGDPFYIAQPEWKGIMNLAAIAALTMRGGAK